MAGRLRFVTNRLDWAFDCPWSGHETWEEAKSLVDFGNWLKDRSTFPLEPSGLWILTLEQFKALATPLLESSR